MSSMPRLPVTRYARYRTDRLYPIRLEEDDGLVHWAWVKNTSQGPCFYVICTSDTTFKGNTVRAFEKPNCLGCYASFYGSENAIWT